MYSRYPAKSASVFADQVTVATLLAGGAGDGDGGGGGGDVAPLIGVTGGAGGAGGGDGGGGVVPVEVTVIDTGTLINRDRPGADSQI